MRRTAKSAVVAGAALALALMVLTPASASAAPREPERQEVRVLLDWLGEGWTRAVEAVSLMIDPNGSTANGAGEPAGDVSWIVDPNG